MPLYDTIIIGAGPAGASAAIYASRAGISALWIDNRFIPGGQVADSSYVDNYPGLPGISGADLGEAMAKHAAGLSMEPVRAKVLRICREDDGTWLAHTKKQDYRAKTVIYAAGAAHRHLGIPGEEELSGSGVSYCATCDGAFFKGQDTAVIGGGNTACEDALFLSKLCKKVYLIHRRDELRADKVLQELVKNTGNLEILWSKVPEEIMGEACVTGLKIRKAGTPESSDRVVGKLERSDRTLGTPESSDRVVGKLERSDRTLGTPESSDRTAGTPDDAAAEPGSTELPVSGVFIAAGMVPNSELLSGIVKLDASGYAAAGEDCVTSAPGLFAAGDIRTKQLRQIVTAVADGANAVASAQKYLQSQR